MGRRLWLLPRWAMGRARRPLDGELRPRSPGQPRPCAARIDLLGQQHRGQVPLAGPMRPILLLVGVIASTGLLSAQTPPSAPSQLGSRPGPGRVLKFHMSWDAAHGYTADSVWTNVYRKSPAGADQAIYRAQQTPAQIGCYL